MIVYPGHSINNWNLYSNNQFQRPTEAMTKPTDIFIGPTSYGAAMNMRNPPIISSYSTYGPSRNNAEFGSTTYINYPPQNTQANGHIYQHADHSFLQPSVNLPPMSGQSYPSSNSLSNLQNSYIQSQESYYPSPEEVQQKTQQPDYYSSLSSGKETVQPEYHLSSDSSQETSQTRYSPSTESLNYYPSKYGFTTQDSQPQTQYGNADNEAHTLSQHFEVTKPVVVPVYKKFPYAVNKRFPVAIPHPVLIPVPHPYPVNVQVSHPVAVPVIKEIKVPIEKEVLYPVEKHVPVHVEKPVSYQVEKHYPVYVNKPYPVKIPITEEIQKPNIVIIMADDLGFNDVSFHGSYEIPTPNIDALAYNGVILNRFYTPPLCTPSRSSLLTGKYPTSIGMQHFVIPSDEPWGLGLDQKIMPQYFKDAGYSTALIGKWHLGFFQEQYTPTKRGFDSHFGYLGPYIGYYDYSLTMFEKNYTKGYDMRRNLVVADDINPKPYVTELFTNEAVKKIQTHNQTSPLFLLINHLAPHAGNEDNPMEAPQDEIDKFLHIPDLKRRTLAAMISILDRGVGEVVKAIKDKGMLENTIIMFYSDNGAPTYGMHSTLGSNYPFRGQKQSGWEGASRNVAVVYSPLIKEPKRVSNEFIHLTDILISLTSAAGIKTNATDLDGINQWPTISQGKPSQRNEFVYNIDPIFGFGALMVDGFKIVNGSLADGEYDRWLGDSGNASILSFENYTELVLESVVSKSIRAIQKESQHLTVKIITNLIKSATVTCGNNKNNHQCDLKNGPCLFNIIEDPCEQNNLAQTNPSQMTIMLNKFSEWTSKVVPSRRKPSEPASNPTNFNGNWNWWQPDSPQFL
ncbi:unnamed protein product [Diamesa serratosioi]